MDEPLLRVTVLLRVLVPFVFMMATVYLATHIVFARFIASPQSQVLWFFATVTGPLIRPLRAVLPPGTPAGRVRAVALAVYLVLWVVTDRLLRAGAPATG
jgi:uncharacterized protein YggT (Ycf19 family)